MLAARLVPIRSLCRESPPMSKGPHDMGGEPAGPIDTVDHGMRFWEKQANALRSTLTSRKVVRLDELRRAAEDLGERYYELEYFERTTAALRRVLIEHGFFTEDESASACA
ncbi:MAG: nitrile hydratase subunit beta [Betaproteobacteria bacterium]|nr:MAG: nitrile hydratase subunit beta [Betaproteobacteria bacterium]